MHVHKGTNIKSIHFKNSKVHYYIFVVYMLHFFNKCLGIQVDNLNLVTNLAYC
jgi:hypothetical protein